MELLSPGVYHNIPAEQYHALPYVSNSYLKRLAKCPANAKVKDPDETKAMLSAMGSISQGSGGRGWRSLHVQAMGRLQRSG